MLVCVVSAQDYELQFISVFETYVIVKYKNDYNVYIPSPEFAIKAGVELFYNIFTKSHFISNIELPSFIKLFFFGFENFNFIFF